VGAALAYPLLTGVLGAFPDRMHINVISVHLLAQVYAAVLRWTELADKEIRTFDRTDALGMTDRTKELLDELLDSWPADPNKAHGHSESL
jgi:hypothetical protein